MAAVLNGETEGTLVTVTRETDRAVKILLSSGADLKTLA
jgi:dihydroxyacetone kinase-like predicted kinase